MVPPQTAAPGLSERRHPRPPKAFTLIELLVVITIIAVLAALFFPTFKRVSEGSKRTKCLSNMRQLGVGFMLYTNDHDGTFPKPGTAVHEEDWLYWQRSRNPELGALVRYMGGSFDPELYRCPSDDINKHEIKEKDLPKYPYSYTVNEKICGHYQAPLKKSQIPAPPRTILLIDESSVTSDDGCWAPQNYAKDGKNLLSNRHDQDSEDPKNIHAGRGNVLFADGHSEFISRADSIDPKFWDPVGYLEPGN